MRDRISGLGSWKGSTEAFDTIYDKVYRNPTLPKTLQSSIKLGNKKVQGCGLPAPGPDPASA